MYPYKPDSRKQGLVTAMWVCVWLILAIAGLTYLLCQTPVTH